MSTRWKERLWVVVPLLVMYYAGFIGGHYHGKRGADRWYAEHPNFVICQDGMAALEAAAVGIRRDNRIVQIPQGCIGIEP